MIQIKYEFPLPNDEKGEGYIVDNNDIKIFLKEKNIDDKDN